MSKNAWLLANELAEKEKWADAYKICKEYLDCDEDNDTWDTLELEEQEKIALLRIECVIKCIVIKDLFSGEYSGKIMIWSDSHDEIVDMLTVAICGLSGHLILSDDEKETKKKFENYYVKVDKMAKEHYLLMLDDIINLMTTTKDESYKDFTSYFQGYNCLCQIIMRRFIDIADILEIEDYKFDQTHYNEAISYQKDRLFDRCLEVTQMITESTSDFPYFDNSDVAYLYIMAIYLAGESIPKNLTHYTQNIRISRLKHKVNLICDFLNAIYVTQGQRVSLCIAEKERERVYAMLLECEKEIKEIENDYKLPTVNKEKFSTVPEKSGGCYVATAIYGAYDCPEVWTLRRYRDYTLAKTWYGRSFVKTYYAISPTLVKWFGHTEWFKKMWKGKLDRMVAKLQDNGVESTPYEDKEWK